MLLHQGSAESCKQLSPEGQPSHQKRTPVNGLADLQSPGVSRRKSCEWAGGPAITRSVAAKIQARIRLRMYVSNLWRNGQKRQVESLHRRPPAGIIPTVAYSR